MLSRTARTWTLLALLVGLAALTAVIAWLGAGQIAAAFRRAGLWVLLLPLWALLPLLFAAESWRLLFPPRHRPTHRLAYHGNWISLAINWLLPVAQVGGELAKAHLAIQRGRPPRDSFASVVVDKTLQMGTQVLYALAGMLMLAALFTGGRAGVLTGALTGTAVLAVLGVLFYRLQRRGLFALVGRVVDRFSRSSDAGGFPRGEEFDLAVRGCYQRQRALWAATAWRLAFRVAMAGEVYLAAWMLGYELTLAEAVVLESLAQTARAGAFLVPGGLGVQEGALAGVAVALGLPPEAGVAISLCKRVRELGLGLPGLLAWQIEQGRGLLRRQSGGGGESQSARQ
ncbi:MAG: lysylphosphatidylglycerol synthase domain-containing protein [Phycisphaeraceae bacterium]